MPDPTTVNKLLAVPTRGSDAGTWDLPVNGDFTALDGMLGGSQIISLSTGTTFSLSAPAGAVTPGAGPNQAQNFMLQFSGTLTGNAIITLPLPGHYFVLNNCTVATSYIQFRAVGTGLLTGIPDGRPVKVWCDGVNVGLCDQPEVASLIDLCMATTPAWFAGCSTLPYLICDGSVDSIATYPILAGRLGSTFGGNGFTTFGRPDFRGRGGIPLDNQGSQGVAGRVTAAGSGVNGTTIAAAGGSELMQQHTHTTNDPGHKHTTTANAANNTGQQAASIVTGLASNVSAGVIGTSTTGITINNAGTGAAQNMPPVIVFGMRLIKT